MSVEDKVASHALGGKDMHQPGVWIATGSGTTSIPERRLPHPDPQKNRQRDLFLQFFQQGISSFSSALGSEKECSLIAHIGSDGGDPYRNDVGMAAAISATFFCDERNESIHRVISQVLSGQTDQFIAGNTRKIQ